ncbi:MAG: PhoH family protein [Spirochaetales bacterium]|nr:PhoH family protein [Spirochaetales bacterium]
MKSFVIDTNVFIHKPDCIDSFRDNEVIIPLMVLEELDKLKSYHDERGRNARQAIRLIAELAKHGNLQQGVKMDNGSLLRVVLSAGKEGPFKLELDLANPDNRILATAYSLQKDGQRVFFVSKDINARVKATALGIKAVDYEKQKVDITSLYPGVREGDISAENLVQLKTQGFLEWNDSLLPNEYICFHREESADIARYNKTKKIIEYIRESEDSVCGIHPLNERQRMALHALLDDSISLVTLVGKAGTGKTLLAIAAGLCKVIEEKKYSRMLVSRPVIPVGKDIGYLPGAKSEKLTHWMQPLFDNLEYILSVYKKTNLKTIDHLFQSNFIELEAVSHIRGRSLPAQFIIIDEAQNLSPHEIKTIVSRAGQGTKVVLTGDPYQIDSPYLDSNSNGLSFLVESFKGQEVYGHISLKKSERSDLAELAATLL